MSSLSLFKQTRYEGREKKRKGGKSKSGGGGERRGGASFGKVLRMPMMEGEGGGKISCGCGRVYLLPSALGGYIFFDSEGELGKSLLPLGDLDNGPFTPGPYRIEMVEKAHGILHRYSCRVHVPGEDLDSLRRRSHLQLVPVEKRLVVHSKREPYDVYIGRPSVWGNPYSHQGETLAKFRVSTREEAIAKYEAWLLGQPELVARAKQELRGKVLGCWCAPKACHGEVLSRIANED
jgi:hypothetical protein